MGVLLRTHPDPARIEALLQGWPWPEAMPPLPALAACAEVGRETLSRNEWVAGATLNTIREPARAEQMVREIEALAPKLHETIEQAIEDEAIEQLGQAFSDADHRHPTRGERQAVLRRMRELWAANRHLAPEDPAEHALSIGTTGKNEVFRLLLPWVPPSLEGALHALPALTWRVPYTSPERALAGGGDIVEEAGAHRAFAMCACEANRVVLLIRKPGWEADSARHQPTLGLEPARRRRLRRCTHHRAERKRELYQLPRRREK